MQQQTTEDNSITFVPERPPRIARLRLFFGYMVILGAFIVRTVPYNWWALALVIAGSCLRMWSAGSLVKTTELSTNGPYAVSRNPLYLGTFMAGLGLTIFVNDLYLMAFFLVTFFFAYRAQILWEEKLLLKEHGQAFVEYCRSVSRFFPLKVNFGNLGEAYSFKQMVHNKELAYQVFWLVVVIGLISKTYLKNTGIGITF